MTKTIQMCQFVQYVKFCRCILGKSLGVKIQCLTSNLKLLQGEIKNAVIYAFVDINEISRNILL